MTQLTLINLHNLHHSEYSQGLCFYPFAGNLHRYMESCYTLHDLSKRVCDPNKTENLNMVGGIKKELLI